MIQNKPLVTNMFTADPSAHVFDGKIYIYPSHDPGEDVENNDNGDQYNMRDYHVFEMTDTENYPKDCGEVLHLKDVPWASKQLWAPDCNKKGDTYY
ncbi:MAG: alpha-N-arabinofuranosidase, partial [Treponema sp.]|nr:alpha-N-arabinofuranosidase [Treponema sp.]